MRGRGERALRAIATSSTLMQASRLNTHPYMASKGLAHVRVPVVSMRVIRENMIAPKVMREIPNNEEIALFSLRYSTYQLASVQMISADGTKCFMPGGRISGAYHRIGLGHTEILCEGIATGYALAEAAKDMDVSIFCCMSANGIKQASATVGHVVAADNDKSRTGVKAANAAGLPYAKPPIVGEDFNDLWQSEPGAVKRAVSALMGAAQSRAGHRIEGYLSRESP